MLSRANINYFSNHNVNAAWYLLMQNSLHMVHTSMHMIMHMSVHKVGFVIASKVLWTDSQLNSYCQR